MVSGTTPPETRSSGRTVLRMSEDHQPEPHGRWVVRGERTLYESPWVRLTKVDVEEPGGRRFEHHVVRMNRVAGAVVPNDRDEVLMLWRHRFIAGSWGWELPMGIVETAETPLAAAAREVEEETGWRPYGLRRIAAFQPAIGIADTPHEIFAADGAERQGAPRDTSEGGQVAWIDLSTVRERIAKGEILDAPSMIGLLLYLNEVGSACQ